MNTDTPPDLIPTRRSLLSRIKSWDDQESWKDFFEIYWKLIYRTARTSGLAHMEAEEAVQETVIAVARKIPEFKYDPKAGSFKSWLLQVTRWKILDQFRKRQDTVPLDEALDAAVLDAPDALDRLGAFDLSEFWDQEWQSNLLEAAFERVQKSADPRQFQIFDLYVRQEWPVWRISAALKINPGRVYLAKHRITKLLAAEVKRLSKTPL